MYLVFPKFSISQFVSDFSNVSNWTTDTHYAAHEADLEWSNSQAAHLKKNELDRSIIIFTHYSPTKLKAGNSPRYVEDSSPVQPAFVTDISEHVCWISVQVSF